MPRVGDILIIPEWNGEGRIAGQPIIDTHIYLDTERFQIWKKKEKPIICKKFLQFRYQKNIVEENNEYCGKCARSLQWGEEHECREMNCF